jgi:Flp pilus assembly protein TadD
VHGTDGAGVAARAAGVTASAGLVRAFAARVPSRVLAALIPAALALLTFAVFAPALSNGFVQWDDHVNLLENRHYRGLTWEQIRWMFGTVLMGHWIPLTWLTFGLDFVLWEMDPRGYHLTSLILFAANAVALYFVALRLLARAVAASPRVTRLAAAAAALFFALHPLRVESVAWATERRDVLSGLFFLLTLLAWLAAVESTGARRRWRLAAACGLYVLAIVSKGSVMVLPAVLILLDVYPLRRLDGRWRAWLRPPARGVWLEKVPFAALGLAAAAITYYAQSSNLFLTTLERYPLAARVAMSYYSVWFYAWKTLLPANLSPLYELPARVDPLAPRFLVPVVAVTALTLALVALARRWPAGLAVWVYYAITIAPVIGIVHSGHQLVHDRYSYLPGLGFALVVGGAVAAGGRAVSRGALRPALGRLAAGVLATWLAALGVMTAQQTQAWHDDDSLWRYALEGDPQCSICHGNLAVHLMRHGMIDVGIDLFTRVVELRPDRVRAHKHLGWGFAMKGELDRAVSHYQRYLTGYPNDGEVLNNLAATLISARRLAEATEVLARTLQVDPGNPLATANVGIVLAEQGRHAEALEQYRRAIRLKWDTPIAWSGLVRSQHALGRVEAARTGYGILSMLDRAFAARVSPLFVEAW